MWVCGGTWILYLILFIFARRQRTYLTGAKWESRRIYIQCWKALYNIFTVNAPPVFILNPSCLWQDKMVPPSPPNSKPQFKTGSYVRGDLHYLHRCASIEIPSSNPDWVNLAVAFYHRFSSALLSVLHHITGGAGPGEMNALWGKTPVTTVSFTWSQRSLTHWAP